MKRSMTMAAMVFVLLLAGKTGKAQTVETNSLQITEWLNHQSSPTLGGYFTFTVSYSWVRQTDGSRTNLHITNVAVSGSPFYFTNVISGSEQWDQFDDHSLYAGSAIVGDHQGTIDYTVDVVLMGDNDYAVSESHSFIWH